MGTQSIGHWGGLPSAAHQGFVLWFWRVCILGSLLMLALGERVPFRMLSYGSMALVGVFCLYEIKRQRFKAASLLAVWLPFGLIAQTMFFGRSLMVPAVTVLPVIIMCGGWLLGQSTALWLLLGAVLMVSGVGIYQELGGEAAVIPPPPVRYVFILAIFYVLAWFVSRLAEQSYADRTRQVENFAFRDQLTHLPNRNLLLDRLDQEVRDCIADDHFSGFILINVKHFELINNSIGHCAGDRLLMQIADRLRSCEGASGTVARVGGDVFAILCRHLGETELEAAAALEPTVAQVYRLFDKAFFIDKLEQHCGVSVGATIFGPQAQAPVELLREAELATRESRREGGEAIRLYDRSLQELAFRRASMEESLRKALEQQQFELFYQPQMNHQRMIGVEALIRWRHPERGLVPPGEFIPVAEESGLVIPMGNWVLNQACNQIRVWQDDPEFSRISVSINVSAAQIAQSNFTEQVINAINNAGIAPERLKLELTESAFVQDANHIAEKMHVLRMSGVRFALDDFGTGYSSLSYLKRLPLDQLKIDQLFVRDQLSGSDGAIIAKTIINLGRDFGLEVIAEGVETEAQQNFLLQHGCHAFQGFLYSKPLPVTELENFFRCKI